MKNKDTWDFAHRHVGRIWHVSGLIMLPVSIIPILFLLGNDTDTIAKAGMIIVYVLLAYLTLSVIPTEITLRKNLTKTGIGKRNKYNFI